MYKNPFDPHILEAADTITRDEEDHKVVYRITAPTDDRFVVRFTYEVRPRLASLDYEILVTATLGPSFLSSDAVRLVRGPVDSNERAFLFRIGQHITERSDRAHRARQEQEAAMWAKFFSEEI